jgi:general secretion pathway protein E
MGIEPYLLSSSVLAILAQRLVRKICETCKESYIPTKEELKGLEIKTDLLFRGKGCSDCFGSTYRGRIGIYELMPVSGEIKKQLLNSADASALQQTAIREGMITLRSQGGHLAKEGLTTTAEVLRVTRKLDLY